MKSMDAKLSWKTAALMTLWRSWLVGWSSLSHSPLAIVSLAAVACSVALADPVPPARQSVSSWIGTRAGQTRDDNGLKLKLVWCPPGQFTMGSPKSEKGRFDEDYETQVQVTLTKGFWLGKFEVTQGLWRRVMHSTPWKGQKYQAREGDDFPAAYVTWDDVMKFCETLTAAERSAGRLPLGWQYTLPTEAEWEYACRAGTTTRFSFGDNDSEIGTYAWYGRFENGNTQNEPYAHPVGLKNRITGVFTICTAIWRNGVATCSARSCREEMTRGSGREKSRPQTSGAGVWATRCGVVAGGTPRDFAARRAEEARHTGTKPHSSASGSHSNRPPSNVGLSEKWRRTDPT
jgi:formylglycine-generating enzyme required for sulfatase activity